MAPGVRRLGLRERLLTEIEASGLPIANIAAECGIEPSAVRNFCAGTGGLSLTSADALADLLGCNVLCCDQAPLVRFPAKLDTDSHDLHEPADPDQVAEASTEGEATP